MTKEENKINSSDNVSISFELFLVRGKQLCFQNASCNYIRSFIRKKKKKKKIGKLVLARNEGCKEAWRQGKTTRKEEERKRGREEASFRGQFVHNVNCRNYYDIIIHPNCTSNRHAKCLIASSGGGRGAEDGIGGQRVETMRGEAGGERYMQLN